jgi:tetratricopeptide (TPR) repeat protein
MSDLQIAIERYVFDQENPSANFALAKEYEKLGQGAAAISFYLRAAERTSSLDVSYICLIKIAQLFDKQKKREYTVQGLYKKAIALLPHRPEAYYFYSKLLENKGDYTTSYMMCQIGLQGEVRSKDDFIGYPGEYALIFQKAVAAWWVGKPKESRVLFREILYNYRELLDSDHYGAVGRNLVFLGTGPTENAFRPYRKELHSKLRYKFPGSENIQVGYGQVMQDIFTLSVLNGKRNGTYLEIGSCYAFRGNNTTLLEKEFGWTGVGIEYDAQYIDEYRANRSNPVLHANALEVDYDEILSGIAVDGVVDYLQLDCDPSDVTYAIMERVPFDKYKFAVITYEHDHQIDMTQSYRDKSRKFLESKGYKLLVSNISPDDISPFEDWWVHPDLIDPEIMAIMEQSTNNVNQIEEYMLQPYEKPVLNISSSRGSLPESFEISKKAKPRVWVVDNFYQDPMAVREFALQQEFLEGGIGRGFIGRRTLNQFLFPGLKERFEQIIGQKINRWEDYGMNGRFQCSYAGEPLVYHADDQKWAGMLFLTPNAPPSCGTSTFAFKGTQVRHKDDPDFFKHFNTECTLDATPYEPVDKLGNVFNRLVIFDAGSIHSASEYFGYNKENSRLWQMFFFD